jgi:hypothetical protein
MEKEPLIIVYYGPAIAGKTHNNMYLNQHLPATHKGDFISTMIYGRDRLVSWDLTFQKRNIRIQWLCNAVYSPQSRCDVLQPANAVVFVADSQPARLTANLKALQEFTEYVQYQESTLDAFPWVIQYTKRDLPEDNRLPFSALQAHLNPFRVPAYEADTLNGVGVIETFDAIFRRVMREEHSEHS